MDRDELDVLLDESAPQPAPVAEHELSAMIRAARDSAPARARRRSRLLVGGAAIAAALLGGGTAAVASGLIDWSNQDYTDPDVSYAFTAPSGRQCEVRIVVTNLADPAPQWDRSRSNTDAVAAVRGLDLATSMDFPAAEAVIAERDAAGPDQTVRLDPQLGWLGDVPEPPSARTADDTFVYTVDIAARQAVWDVLAQNGYVDAAGRLIDDIGFSGGARCEAERQ